MPYYIKVSVKILNSQFKITSVLSEDSSILTTSKFYDHFLTSVVPISKTHICSYAPIQIFSRILP